MRGRYWPVDFSSAAYRFKITETLHELHVARVTVEVESVRSEFPPSFSYRRRITAEF